MNESRKTKKALRGSLLALFLCVVLLIGTTFAWFTDTATTGVNKIQSGRLDVELQYSTDGGDTWANAEGETLDFQKAKGAEAEAILWEPGCRYELPKLRVVNNGNLALKYKIQITGIKGDEKLNEVIDWTINGEDINLTEQHLRAGQQGAGFTIKGQMQTSAGNEYQGLSIDGISITVVATQDTVESDSFGTDYDKNAEYPTIKTADSLEEVFGGADVDFGYGSTSTDPVILDGQGTAIVKKWTDAWVNSDMTIKGVTFKNGAVFSTKTDNITVTLENCTFYACDQSKLTYTGNNSLTNSGAGMCLNLEKSSNSGIRFVVKNCTFIGENDSTLPVAGPRYNGNGKIDGMKKRGHAIALDAICGGGTGTLDSLLIEGCNISGVRGNAIQLYGTTGDITIKDTKINSWAVNNTGVGYAVRGDFNTGGSRKLTLNNVYFGLDEISGNTEFGHVKVGSFPGNTNGSETAGTYSK